MKFLFSTFILLITLLATTYNQESEKTEIETTNMFYEQAKGIFKEMGLEPSGEITREQFETLFFRIITKDKDVKESNKLFYDAIAKKLSDDMPNKIKVSEMARHMSKDKVVLAIEDTVRVQFGEKYVSQIREQFTDAFKESEKKMSNSQEKEKNQTQKKEQNTNEEKHKQINNRSHNNTKHDVEDL